MFSYIKKSYALLSSHFKKRIPFIISGYLVLSFFETIGIILIFPITALMVDADYVMNFSWYQRLSLYVSSSFLTQITLFLPPLMILIFIFKNILAIFINKWQIHLINNQSSSISTSLFKRYVNMPYLESIPRDNGHLNFTILSAGSILYNSYVTPLLQLVSEIITILILTLILISFSAKAAIVSFLLTLFLGGITFVLTRKKLKQTGIENRFYSELMVRTIKEVFSNFKEFKIMGRESFFNKRFIENRDRVMINLSRQMTFTMLNRHVIEILLFVSTAIISYTIILNNPKVIAIAQISLYGMIIIRLIPSITRIFTSLQTMKTAESAIDLLTDEHCTFSDCPSSSLTGEEKKSLENPKIIFDNVCFTYPNQTKRALEDINFEIKPNTMVGIVGKTGSGKTTLVDALLGLIPISSGSLSINGHLIEDISSAWTRELGYVPQKVSFLGTSLKENIAYGIPLNEIDIERVKKVVNIAQLEEDIAKLENGLDTMISEDGSNLSGGQKQRIGIARALYNAPRVLVMDEATAALDIETEAKISEAMEHIKKECTLIIIAHRLKTIRNCENILYIDNGKLIAQGTFDDLSNSNKKFMNLIKLSEF